MIKANDLPRFGEPLCSCGKYTMRFCVTRWAYCGKQAVSLSRRWREKLIAAASAQEPKL